MIRENNYTSAIGLIDKSRNILIVTHTRPDGDACGCVVALNELFTQLGKNPEILLLSDLPQWYAFLFDKTPLVASGVEPAFFSKDFSADKLDSFDLIVIADTNSKSQLPGFADLLEKNKKPVLVIDHHATNDGLGDVELADTSAAAAGLIVFDLIKYARWPITEKIAKSLFVAIATDTGWFRFTNTDSRVHRACSELLDLGVSPSEIYHILYQSFSLPRFHLMIAMLNSLELHFNGRLATQFLRRKDFEQTAASDTDTENLIDECQRIATVEAAALFVELKDGRIRCSLRSRGVVDVRQIAQKFGGGGHPQASGAYLPPPIENAKKLILDLVSQQLKIK